MQGATGGPLAGFAAVDSWAARRRTQNPSIPWAAPKTLARGRGQPDRVLRADQVGLPDISNNVGSVKYFLNAPLCSLRRVVFVVLLDLCIDDHGPLVIFRSASVRPRHLFDPYFDHDCFFELPFRGSGMPHQVHGVLLHAMSGSELSRVRTEL